MPEQCSTPISDSDLDVLLDGAMDVPQVAEMESHLQTCAACRAHKTFLERLRIVTREAELTDSAVAVTPSDLRNRVLRTLNEEASPGQVAKPSSVAGPSVGQYLSRLMTMIVAQEFAERNEERLGELLPHRAQLTRGQDLKWRMRRIAACVAVLIGVSLLIRWWVVAEAPQFAADLVEHHVACWVIAPSPGRKAQFEGWLHRHGNQMPPLPALPAELVRYDVRECPTGDTRGPHFLYHWNGQQVSIYAVPARDIGAKDSPPEGPARTYRYKEFSVALWQRNGFVYGIVTPASERDLIGLVASIQRQESAREMADSRAPSL